MNEGGGTGSMEPVGSRPRLGPPTGAPVPPRAAALSLVCFGVAALVGSTDLGVAARYSSFVWILALIPVFLLSYYRGWRGATLGAATGMVVLTAVELVVIRLRGQQIDWWLIGTATTLLVSISMCAGLLSELLRRQRALALELAFGDPTTDVANRRWLREAVTSAIAASNGVSGIGLVFFDLVDFKSVNDRHGHVAGDAVLRQLGARLVASCRAGDSVARVGGDEFVVLCENVSSRDSVVAIAERTLEDLSHPFHAGDSEVYLQARIGVAWYPDHAATFDELLSNADPVRPGRGKPRGGDIVVYDPAVDSPVSERRLLETDVGSAMDSGALFFALQPVVEVEGRHVVGIEALARLDHPRLGVVSAHSFVASARAAGRMYELDVRVLRMALEHAAGWTTDAPDWIAVNISYETLATYGFLEDLAGSIADSGVAPQSLVVEVSTAPALRSSEWVLATLSRIRALGARIALDNFGPRSFSLSYLAQIEADFLKLDRTVVAGIGTATEHERVARGIIGLAKSLGMTTTAVGVESPDQLRWLAANGCPLAQGYLTGRPIETRAVTSPGVAAAV